MIVNIGSEKYWIGDDHQMKRFTALLLITLLALTMTSCRININLNKQAEEPEQEEEQQIPEDPEDTAEDVLKAVVPPDDFDLVGEYQDETSQRATMTVTPDGEDHYQVEIVWGGSATEMAVWTFEGDFDYASGMLTYDNGRKVIDDFKEDGSQSEEVVYEGSKGALMYYDEGLHWQDDKDDTGKDCHFIKTGDLDNVIIEEEEE